MTLVVVCGPHDNTNVTHMALGGPSVWHACLRALSGTQVNNTKKKLSCVSVCVVILLWRYHLHAGRSRNRGSIFDRVHFALPHIVHNGPGAQPAFNWTGPRERSPRT